MKNLKQLRLEKKVSQQTLAEYCNVSQQSIYKYENNLAEPELITLMRLADYFNTSIDYLVGYTASPDVENIIIEIPLEPNDISYVKKYVKLSSKRKKVIQDMIDCLNESPISPTKQEIPPWF